MSRPSPLRLLLVLACGAAATAAAPRAAAPAPPPFPPPPFAGAAALGGGNVGTNGATDAGVRAQLAALSAGGAGGGCRTNLYPGAYIKDGKDWDSPTPQSLDAFMALALAANVTPVVLFEYYAPDFLNASGFGSRAQWRALGAAFAAHLRPGGTWAAAAGAPAGFGITDFTAINEPDGGTGFLAGGQPGPDAYAAALAGLGEGVHSVAPGLRAFPGGFMSANAFDDVTLRGLAAKLGPLWSNGTLDGLDLHTYFDVQYAPMEGTHARSAQANFDGVLRAAGVAPAGSGVLFTSTEFNYKERLESEQYSAQGLFTAVFDGVGVVDGANAPVALRVFPWNVFDTNASDADYGMAASLAPYVPTPRGCAWLLAVALLRLGGGWAVRSADPRGTGVLELESGEGDAAALLVVWQDRRGWTSLPTFPASFTVQGIPAAATSLQVLGYGGQRGATVPLAPGQGSATVSGLEENNTWAFLSLGPAAGPLRMPEACPALQRAAME